MGSFEDFAQSVGVDIMDAIADDRIHRAPTHTKPHKWNAAYKWNGRAGWIKNYETAELHSYSSSEPVSDEMRRRYREMAEESRRRASLERARACKRAEAVLANCRIEQHPYLMRKAILLKAHVSQSGALAVPMYDFRSRELVGLEYILWDAESKSYIKRRIKGQQSENAVNWVRNTPGSKIILCEGWANALSLGIACDMFCYSTIIACFGAENLARIGARLSPKEAMVYADGDEKGRNAAKASGLPWFDPGDGLDANDILVSQGALRLCRQIEQLSRRCC